MSVEHDNPEIIGEIREIAHEWLLDRPTIRHTPLSLLHLVQDEVRELKEASTNKEVVMELGDVLFSTLSMDDRSGMVHEVKSDNASVDEVEAIAKVFSDISCHPETIFHLAETGPKFTKFGYGQIDHIYSLIFGLANKKMLDIKSLFDKTLDKNSINYPFIFFNEMTPFVNPSNAISALRILRNASKNVPEKLNEFWVHSERQIYDNQPFFDGWVSTGKLRSMIKSRLTEIYNSKNGGVDDATKKEISRLKKIGEWDMTPLEIPGNRYNWHLW